MVPGHRSGWAGWWRSDIGGLPVQDRNNVVFVPLMAAILRLEDSQSYLKDDRRIYLNLSPEASVTATGETRTCSTPRTERGRL